MQFLQSKNVHAGNDGEFYKQQQGYSKVYFSYTLHFSGVSRVTRCKRNTLIADYKLMHKIYA